MEVYGCGENHILCNKADVLHLWKNEFDQIYNTTITNDKNLVFETHIKNYIRLHVNLMKDPLYESSIVLNKTITDDEIARLANKVKIYIKRQ